ncbi:MAG: N-acetylmuramoyl-L-alanine amidase [Candidatus Paceibacterota bacterium]
MINFRKTSIRKYFLYLLITGVVIFLFYFVIHKNVFKRQAESVIPEQAVVVPTAANPLTILLVPGHDPDTGGASFKGVYERDLAVDVANNIAILLERDLRYKIIVARDKQAWSPVFADYFVNDKQAILDFKNEHQTAYDLLVASGEEIVVPDMGEHTLVNPRVAVELYGTNKWANENDVDLIIHLHFNNSTRRNTKLPGPRHGFVMYIPQKQNVNAASSRVIAQYIYNELKKKFSPEAPGYYNSLFEDHSLIALGAFNTLDKPAVLIEYEYIYDKVLQDKTSRDNALEQMAEQTVAGIKDYVDSISLEN